MTENVDDAKGRVKEAAGELTDDQIWNLVNFVRSFRHPV